MVSHALNILSKYFHTVRYLRPEQIAARAWYAVRRVRPDERAAPGQRETRVAFVAPIAPARKMTGPAEFMFLNETRDCASREAWTDPGASKLWRYNLHYFDDLNAVGADERRPWHECLIGRWVDQNPPGRGDGWEPYPLSLRIVNWIKWSLQGGELTPTALHSLAVQIRWLRGSLEYHILGNHLFANAKALVFSGLFFAGQEADRWHEKGIQIIERELAEQVLADGGHFELSTMYHAIFLADLLDLVNVLKTYSRTVPETWISHINRMSSWLAAMNHPDGDIGFFNDAALDIAPNQSEIGTYRSRLGLDVSEGDPGVSVVLRDSGYIRAVSGHACLICDCAPVGPTYLPGHAHADTLSFELSVRGQRVLVNSGTSTYVPGNERQRQRGTAAHNTLVVDGRDSSEVWAGFRVARRANAVLHEADLSAPTIISASHDGYCRLPGRHIHSRRWQLDVDDLYIEDRVSGPIVPANAYFHAHPNYHATRAASDTIRLESREADPVLIHFSDAKNIRIEDGTWHPRFGVTERNQVIIVSLASNALDTHISWATI